jgi:hypothetical protein
MNELPLILFGLLCLLFGVFVGYRVGSGSSVFYKKIKKTEVTNNDKEV